jgi:Outer membrane protein beta-barrel domain
MQQMRMRCVLLPVVSVLGFMCLQPACAQSDPFGLYAGLGIGRSTFGNGFYVINPNDATPFAQSELGFKGLIGVRPIPWVGAELEYIDFGTSRAGTEAAAIVDGMNNGQFLGGSAAERAGALFAVGYLPLPRGWPEFFGKVGWARLWGRYSYTGDYTIATPTGTTYSTIYTSQTADSRGLALGAGVQVPLGGMSVRAEYERVEGSQNYGLHEKPTLVSASVIWSF